jgi:hypothetical protein
LFRALPIIVSAILLSRPRMPMPEARRYARVLQEEASRHAFDPLTAVAIVHFETHWQPGLVSPDGEDYGLGQIRARWMSACRGDADPVHDPSDGCRAAKAALLVGENNLRRMSVIITANRELCKDKTGTANLPQWLAGYEGLNVPDRDRWCAPSSLTFRVVEYRQKLLALLGPKPRHALATVAQATKTTNPRRRAESTHEKPAPARSGGRVAQGSR